ncbi:MAG: DUF1990 family protein [Proteobacteria bacterium]|nr:MAG: DUF1990 family protein [Pseudomonadota bacterium]
MAEWRFGRGWTKPELEQRLEHAKTLGYNFPLVGPESQEGSNWQRYYSESVIAKEPKGPPAEGGAFYIAWKAITEYQFSDPGIVTGHFDPREPLRGRSMLLEIKVIGLRYLCGVRVSDTKETRGESETQLAFRYDTLDGHLEVGSEWFSLTKKHETGEVIFRISASWRKGQFPNWWSRVGFQMVGHRYQLAWHRLAYLRLRKIVGSGGADLVPVPRGEKIVHTSPELNNSSLWILKQPVVAERVRQAGNEENPCPPDSEVQTSSSSPEPRRE